jgi:hypothetical protein
MNKCKCDEVLEVWRWNYASNYELLEVLDEN